MGTTARKRRVLIVEPDELVAERVAARAVELGLDPVMCRGVRSNGACPVLHGDECSKNAGCGAVFVSLDGDPQARVAQGCAGDAPMLLARPTFGSARVIVADRHLEQPYSPEHAALLLYAFADAEVPPRKHVTGGIPHVGA